jgi:hypothetical protein
VSEDPLSLGGGVLVSLEASEAVEVETALFALLMRTPPYFFLL